MPLADLITGQCTSFAAPIGTHHIWREIWLDRLDDQSRLVGRLDAIESGGSRPAGEIEDVVFDATRPSLRAG